MNEIFQEHTKNTQEHTKKQASEKPERKIKEVSGQEQLSPQRELAFQVQCGLVGCSLCVCVLCNVLMICVLLGRIKCLGWS